MAAQNDAEVQALEGDIGAWVLVRDTDDASSLSSQLSSQASPRTCASWSIEHSVEFMAEEVLEPLIAHVAQFMVGARHANDPQQLARDGDIVRVCFASIDMLCSTCRVFRAARTSLLVDAFHVAQNHRDALAISQVLLQQQAIDPRVREAGVTTLLRMLRTPETGLLGEIFDPETTQEALEHEESECIRIAAWEKGALAVITSLQVIVHVDSPVLVFAQFILFPARLHDRLCPTSRAWLQLQAMRQNAL